MANNLVVVESPGKTSIITKYLNNNPQLTSKYGKFTVIASMGHIRDLAKKTLAIDIENEFSPQYEFSSDKKDVISNLKQKAKGADNIFIASDGDDEGEFIGDSIRVALNLGNNDYKRIRFTEITPKALQYAIEHPTKLDQNQLESQKCRRTLDRLVGFKTSPLLWKKFTSGSVTLSAGRVQSAVMHIIIQREKEIEKFISTRYWHVNGDFKLKLNNIQDSFNLDQVRLYKDDTIYKTENIEDIKSLFKDIKDEWTITSVKQKTSKQNPDAPFITSTLQQEASSKLHTGIKKIMQLAQKLYEGGHITYMRTDSYNMSEDFKKDTSSWIKNKYGAEYVGSGVLHKKTVKGAQEAHECIRPTHVENIIIDGIPKDQQDLYELIWKRSVAFLMAPAIFDELDINFKDQSMTKKMEFMTTFKKVQFNGFLAVYGVKNEKSDNKSVLTMLEKKQYTLSCIELRSKNTYSSPPSRFNDSSLVKAMEQAGIGRPSTYSATIDKLYEKNYVLKSDIKGEEKKTIDIVFTPKNKSIKMVEGVVDLGADKGKIKPTDIGIQIDSYLEDHFAYITDKTFTSTMEAELDKISEGKKDRLEVLNSFWKRFSKDLKEQLSKKEDKKVITTESKMIKLDNGREYAVRIAKYGPVIQYQDANDAKTKYIPLKGYLSMTKKEYTDIDETDIKLLASLPKVIGKFQDQPIALNIGPYGLYLVHNKKNVKIPAFALKKYMETSKFTDAELQGFIEYTKKERPLSSSIIKSPRPTSASITSKSNIKSTIKSKSKSASTKTKKSLSKQ